MILFYQLLLGLVGSSLIGFLAYISSYLTFSGLLALIGIGTLTFCLGQPIFWLLLVLLFASSVLISVIKGHLYPKKATSELVEKGSRRDAWQLLANALPFLICLMGNHLEPQPLWGILAASALAGATADTWSSEIGILSPKAPRNIVTLKPEKTGLSGAVSGLGLVAGFGGSLLISLTYAGALSLFAKTDPGFLKLLTIVLLAGFSNTLIDSFLGATIQAKYLCTICGKVTERKIHHNTPGFRVAGWPLVNNDLVNLLAGLLTLVVAWLLSLYI